MEKSKSSKIFTNLNIKPTKNQKAKKVDLQPHLRSGNLGHLSEYNFHEKIQKLFESKKFSMGNQFDQRGCEKFLAEKNECLKCIDLDYTILDKENSKKNKRKSKSKSKTHKRKTAHSKYFPPIEFINEDDESFFSTESSKQIIREFVN